MKMSILDRVLLLITGLLAAYQIAFVIDGFSTLPLIAYTIAFGVLLVSGLLLILLGFEILDNPAVVIVSTIIPLFLSLGLVWQHLASFRILYLVFVIIGFLAITITRSFPMPGNMYRPSCLPSFMVLQVMTIFLLPIILSMQGLTNPLFLFVGVGGALIGIGGLLLSFLKVGKPISIERSNISKSCQGFYY